MNPINKQKLSWNDLRSAISSVDHKSSEEGVEFVSNVLLQVIMPIVLVLAIIVFSRIGVLEAVIEEISQRSSQKSYELTYLELQKQVLIRVLSELKSEERDILDIDLFLRREVRIIDGQLDDSDFIRMTENTFDRFGRPDLIESAENSMFSQLIARASTELEKISLDNELAYQKIDEENVDFAQAGVREFFSEAKREVTQIQHETIKRVFDYFVWYPDELRDSSLSDLIETYTSSSEEDKPTMIKQINTRLNEVVQERISASGYKFLPDTWRELD